MKKIAILIGILATLATFSAKAQETQYFAMKVGGSWRYIPAFPIEEAKPASVTLPSKPLKDLLKEFEERQNSFLVRTIIDEENTLQIFAVRRHRVFTEDYLEFTPEELFKKESMIILSIPKKLDKLDLKAL